MYLLQLLIFCQCHHLFFSQVLPGRSRLLAKKSSNWQQTRALLVTSRVCFILFILKRFEYALRHFALEAILEFVQSFVTLLVEVLVKRLPGKLTKWMQRKGAVILGSNNVCSCFSWPSVRRLTGLWERSKSVSAISIHSFDSGALRFGMRPDCHWNVCAKLWAKIGTPGLPSQ